MTDITLALGGLPVQVQTLSHKSSRVKLKKKKKEVKPKKAVPPRIVIVSAVELTQNSIRKQLKLLEPKTIEFVILANYSHADLAVQNVCDQLKIPVIYVMPWTIPGSGYLQRGSLMRLFKPTMILAFAKKDSEDQAVIDFEKFARKSDIDFKLVSK